MPTAERLSWALLASATLAACAGAVFLVLYSSSDAEQYDFVVVGGGATGSVVAGRLGQAGYSVLVLEAGGPTQQSLGGKQAVHGRWTIFDVPLGWVQVLSDHRWSKQFQWDVPADPPPAIARGLGGCGIHNAMLYMRGRPEDFGWGPGWEWEDVLPYYRRSEANQQHHSSRIHGTDGPVAVTSVPSDNISRAFVSSSCRAGLVYNDDFNGDSREGVGYYQFMIRDGVRDSAAAAFIGSRTRPRSVTVRTHSLVSRVLFDGSRRATGVEYVRGKNPTNLAQKIVVAARYEVILSSGAVNTPKLLMLSGIGDRARLEQLGIGVVHHNPSVGRGLADGVYAIMQWASRQGDFVRCRLDSWGRGENSDYCRVQLERWAAGDRSSVFASPGMSAGAFLRSPYARGAEPDVQLTLHPWDKYGRTWAADYGGIASLEIANNHPSSRGRVTLRSSRFADAPIFEGPYLANANDSRALIWAVRHVRQIASELPLARMLTAELVPGPQAQTDAQIHDSIACGPQQFRQVGRPACDRSELPVNHLAGTCRLGRVSDRTTVVDLELRVVGVHGLRVADASVMPRPPSGNTHATCMMIGERAADFILQATRDAERRSPGNSPSKE